VAVRSEDHVDARHGPRERVVFFDVGVADERHDVHVLLFAQGRDHLTRGGHAVGEDRARRGPAHERDQAVEVAPDHGEDTHAHAVGREDHVGFARDVEEPLAPVAREHVRPENGVAQRAAAAFEVLGSVVGVVVAVGHRVDDAVEPRPLDAAVTV